MYGNCFFFFASNKFTRAYSGLYRWFLVHVIGLIDRVGYVEPIECFTCTRIEEMNLLREVIAALFHRKSYHGESTTCKWRCCPKRVLIRERGHSACYYLRRNSNLYEIFLFCKAHCTGKIPTRAAGSHRRLQCMEAEVSFASTVTATVCQVLS